MQLILQFHLRREEEEPIVWLDDRSLGKIWNRPKEPAAIWGPLWKYSDEYEHPLWRQWKETADKTGH